MDRAELEHLEDVCAGIRRDIEEFAILCAGNARILAVVRRCRAELKRLAREIRERRKVH